MSPLQIACAVLVSLFWGLQFVVIKVGLAAFPPLFFVALRFAAVAAILLPFVGRPTRRELGPMIVISAFFGGLNFALFFAGLGQGLASVLAVANQLSTPFTVLLAWPCLGERPSTRVIIGVALAFGGVALTVAEPTGSVKIVPTLLVIAAGSALAVGSVLTKRYGPFEPLKLMAWMSLFTVPQVMATSLVIEHGQLASLHAASLTAWLAFAYTVLFGGIAGWGLWFWLIARCPMTRVVPFALLQVVFAIAAGVAVLHDPLSLTLIAGAGICIVGVAITQSRSFDRHSLPTRPRAPVEPKFLAGCSVQEDIFVSGTAHSVRMKGKYTDGEVRFSPRGISGRLGLCAGRAFASGGGA
jgi:O-acetylserine/cysteine efflux transporter